MCGWEQGGARVNRPIPEPMGVACVGSGLARLQLNEPPKVDRGRRQLALDQALRFGRAVRARSILWLSCLVICGLPGTPSADEGTFSRVMADKILVDKSRRLLQLVHGRTVLRTYRIALGRNPLGPKQRRGDRRTPEGIYHVSARNPQSRFHLSLRISYPSPADRARATQQGVDPGGDIMIHGLGDQRSHFGAMHTETDWTDGCIAVTDREIREIWDLVPIGTYIEIRP